MSATPADANELKSMQQEALRRVQEMQDRARRTVGIEETGEESPTGVPTGATPVRRSHREKQDNETTLITLLLLILMAENASPELVFALLYLLA